MHINSTSAPTTKNPHRPGLLIVRLFHGPRIKEKPSHAVPTLARSGATRSSLTVGSWRFNNALEDLWEGRFQESIGEWVHQLRIERQNKLAGKQHDLKDGWEERLDYVGFQWKAPIALF